MFDRIPPGVPGRWPLLALLIVFACGPDRGDPTPEPSPHGTPTAPLLLCEDPQIYYPDDDGDGLGDDGQPLTACDPPEGYVEIGGDCDDTDAEILQTRTWYLDYDGDGYGGQATTREVCEGPEGFVTNSEDCDDADEAINPETVWYKDTDGDGYGTDALTLTQCLAPPGFAFEAGDCDDGEAAVNPDADEACGDEGASPADEDCDGEIDEAGGAPYVLDLDGDGAGDPSRPGSRCEAPDEAVPPPQEGQGDCDDRDPAVHPGADERCDGGDDDCDGAVDEGLDQSWILDRDGDGYGDPGSLDEGCDPPEGALPPLSEGDEGDCDDADAASYPGADERCDARDNDCDEAVDEGLDQRWILDRDGDGYGDPDSLTVGCAPPQGSLPPLSEGQQGDCDDADAASYPGADEICDEGDNDCDGQTDEGVQTPYILDRDGDGFGDPGSLTVGCAPPQGSLPPLEDPAEADCDDLDFDVHPWAAEACDGLDQDCDDVIDEDAFLFFYRDADGDGYGDPTVERSGCAPDPGFVTSYEDCDDTRADTHPGARELCDALDNDCDEDVDEDAGVLQHVDADRDGYGDPDATGVACPGTPGLTADGTDCDDTRAADFPGAPERCDGLDNDCDDAADEGVEGPRLYPDEDGDGFGADVAPVVGCGDDDLPGGVSFTGDCDDHDPDVHPGAIDFNGDGGDKDCGGTDSADPHVGLNARSLSLSQALTFSGISGQTVWIGPGVYTARGLNPPSTISALRSVAGPDRTTLDASGAAGSVFTLVSRGGTLRLTGLTLTGGDPEGGYGGAIEARSSGLRLEDMILEGNHADGSGGGMYVSGGTTAVVNTIVRDNVSGYLGGGIALFDAPFDGQILTVRGNEAESNGGGIYAAHKAPTLENVLIADNEAGVSGGGIYYSNVPVTLSQATVADNRAGEGGGIHALFGCTLRNTLLSRNLGGAGAQLLIPSPKSCKLERARFWTEGGANGVSGLTTGDSSVGVIRFVNDGSDGSLRDNDYHPLPTDGAINGGSVTGCLHPDPSVGCLDQDGSFPDLGFYGGPNAPTADRDGDGIADEWEVTRGLSLKGDGDLDGDGISDSSEWATLTDPTDRDTDHDGIDDGDEASIEEARSAAYPGSHSDPGYLYVPEDYPTVRAAVRAAGPRGYILVAPGTYEGPVEIYQQAVVLKGLKGPGSTVLTSPTPGRRPLTLGGAPGASWVQGFTVTGGDATIGGGLAAFGAASHLEDLVVEDSAAALDGGGLFLAGGGVSLTQCVVTGNHARNRGGGAALYGAVSLLHCRIADNDAAAGGGGITGNLDAAQLDHLTVVNNDSPGSIYGGGGLYVSNTGATLRHSVVYGNSSGRGGGIAAYADVTLVNSIVFANTSVGPANVYAYSTTVSLIGRGLILYDPASGGAGAGGITLTGSYVTADPRFLFAPGWDFHLEAASPAVNAGVGQSCLAAASGAAACLDVDGSAPDLGIYGSVEGGLQDLDFDDRPDYPWPGPFSPIPAGLGGEPWDCDDLDPEAPCL